MRVLRDADDGGVARGLLLDERNRRGGAGARTKRKERKSSKPKQSHRCGIRCCFLSSLWMDVLGFVIAVAVAVGGLSLSQPYKGAQI